MSRTLLAGVLRDTRPLLAQAADDRPPLLDFLYGMNALVGDYGPRTQAFGEATLSFEGPDTSKGPMFDLVHALSSTLPFEQTGPFLDVVEQLFRDHEREVGGLVEAILYIKERSDAYPNAKWQKPHDFWDDLIGWGVRVAETPGLLEAMLRSLTAEETAKAGPLIGNALSPRPLARAP